MSLARKFKMSWGLWFFLPRFCPIIQFRHGTQNTRDVRTKTNAQKYCFCRTDLIASPQNATYPTLPRKGILFSEAPCPESQ